MPRIYTRTGDQGLTSLYGGQRVPKFQTRVAVFGALDELNANLGLVVSELTDEAGKLRDALLGIQNTLFNIGAEAAEGGTKTGRMIEDSLRVGEAHVTDLERLIDRYDGELESLTTFILPGGSPAGARLHLARAVCRRTERRLALLAQDEMVNPESLRYLNRLSDLLFVLARTINQRAGAAERPWRKEQ